MINKIKNGAQFYDCIRYILREASKYPGNTLPEKMVYFMCSRGVFIPKDRNGEFVFRAKDIAREFTVQAMQNTRVKHPVKHVILSWKEEDLPTLQKLHKQGELTKIIEKYLQKQGWGSCQFFCVLHRDKNNPHVHIVINMIDRQGKRYQSGNDFYKGVQICKEISKEYGFIMGKPKEIGFTSIGDITDPRERARYRTAVIVEKGLSSPGIYTFADLQRYLKNHAVEMTYRDANTESGRTIISGVKFHYEDFCFWGSYLSRELSAGAIARRLAEKRRQAQEEYDKRRREESVKESPAESHDTKINIAAGKTTRSNADASKNSGELEHRGIKI